MKIIVLFLLVVASCNTPNVRQKSIWGANMVNINCPPNIFVANYLAYNHGGKYLSAPLVFRISQDRSALSIFFNGKVNVAYQTDPINKLFAAQYDDVTVYYKICNGYVSIEYAGVKILALRKTMI